MVFDKREKEVLNDYRDLFLSLGLIMVIFGVILILFPVFGSFAIDVLLGLSLFVLGIMGVIVGFVSIKWKGSLFVILNGIVGIILGLMLLFFPKGGVVTLTLLMGVYLMVQGVFELGKASSLKEKFWKRAIYIDGFFCLLLGLLVIVGWPSDSTWAVGLIFGISLLCVGFMLVGLSRAVKREVSKK